MSERTAEALLGRSNERTNVEENSNEEENDVIFIALLAKDEEEEASPPPSSTCVLILYIYIFSKKNNCLSLDIVYVLTQSCARNPARKNEGTEEEEEIEIDKTTFLLVTFNQFLLTPLVSFFHLCVSIVVKNVVIAEEKQTACGNQTINKSAKLSCPKLNNP